MRSEPTKTTPFLPLVTPVYRRFLFASIGGKYAIGMIDVYKRQSKS